MPLLSYKTVAHQFYSISTHLGAIMYVVCIECDSVVTARMHAVSCDICEGWQHRRCGTGKIIFVFINASFHVHNVLSRKLTAVETMRFIPTPTLIRSSIIIILYKCGKTYLLVLLVSYFFPKSYQGSPRGQSWVPSYSCSISMTYQTACSPKFVSLQMILQCT